MPSFLRRLGNLSGTLLNDQLERQRMKYQSGLEQQRQEEVAKSALADKMVANLGPRLASGEITLDQIPVQPTDPLYSQLQNYAATAPSTATRGAKAVAPVMDAIAKAKSPEELGSEEATVGQARNDMQTANVPEEYGVNDPALKVRQVFVSQQAQMGRNQTAADVRQKATKQSDYNIEHPDEAEQVVFQSVGADGKPAGPLMVQDATAPGGYRPAQPTDKLQKGQVHYIEGKPESTGNDRPYFTLQPVYDKTGRPIGGIRMEGRTGKTQFITTDQLGGELKGPPGNIGVQDIANEASLDALDNLKGMFDNGAKNLVGPAEGRLRVLGQKIPGVPTNGEFANFDAASSAFKNAVIKAITGAQMSEVEATRIQQQIPLVTDKADVWKAKEAQTRKNLAFLEARTKSARPDTTDSTDPAGLFK